MTQSTLWWLCPILIFPAILLSILTTLSTASSHPNHSRPLCASHVPSTCTESILRYAFTPINCALKQIFGLSFFFIYQMSLNDPGTSTQLQAGVMMAGKYMSIVKPFSYGRYIHKQPQIWPSDLVFQKGYFIFYVFKAWFYVFKMCYTFFFFYSVLAFLFFSFLF